MLMLLLVTQLLASGRVVQDGQYGSHMNASASPEALLQLPRSQRMETMRRRNAESRERTGRGAALGRALQSSESDFNKSELQATQPGRILLNGGGNVPSTTEAALLAFRDAQPPSVFAPGGCLHSWATEDPCDASWHGVSQHTKRAQRCSVKSLDFSLLQVICQGLEVAALGFSPDGQAQWFNGCGFTAVPPALNQLHSLQAVDLSGNQITSVADSALNSSSLYSLDLSSNRLEVLPTSVCGCSGLQSLYAMDNRLTFLPECIGALVNLQELFLQNNRLFSLPESIGKLQQLTDLELTGNGLRALPAAIGL